MTGTSSDRPNDIVAAAAPGRRGSYVDTPGLALVLNLAGRLYCGSLEIRLPDGTTRLFRGQETGPEASLLLRNGRVARRYLTGGAVGFAEGYINGDWDTADLATLLRLLTLNEHAWGDNYFGGMWQRWLRRAQHLLRSNTRTGSRRNIHAHYDLGNAFFAAWLDPSMTYSAAMFADGVTDLEQAQLAKYHALAERIAIRPGHHVLEIGSGWGGFAITAAKQFGAKVTSITVSKAQAEHARERVFKAGLTEQVEIRLQDYRDVQGRFDRIASIEMLEAVGERFWPAYFNGLRHRLRPGGQAGLQLITIADQYFDDYRRNADFIQTYIFPGGMLPSPIVLEQQIRAAGLVTQASHSFGGCYARTLQIWNERFQNAWPRMRMLGFDERFRRIWTYYLAYCEAGFRTGSIDVVQTTLRPA